VPFSDRRLGVWWVRGLDRTERVIFPCVARAVLVPVLRQQKPEASTFHVMSSDSAPIRMWSLPPEASRSDGVPHAE
jgi:hypothetical protein